MNAQHRSQRGLTIYHILAVLVVIFIGVYFISENKKQQKHKAELAETALAEAALAEASKNAAELAKIAAENAELKARLAQQLNADEYSKSLKAVDNLYQRWTDGLKVAESTGRISLAQPVATLQSLKNEASNIQTPPCLDGAKADLTSGMTLIVDGFLDFMQNKGDLANFLAGARFINAKPKFEAFETARKLCPESQPLSQSSKAS